MPWLKRLVAALSTAEALFRSQVIPREICSGQNNIGTGFSRSISGFLLLVLFHQYSIHIFLYTLFVAEGQTCQAWKPTKEQRSFRNRGALVKKGFDDETFRCSVQVSPYCTHGTTTTFSGCQHLYNWVKIHPKYRTPALSSS